MRVRIEALFQPFEHLGITLGAGGRVAAQQALAGAAECGCPLVKAALQLVELDLQLLAYSFGLRPALVGAHLMHGGKLFLRGSCEDIRFPGQVRVAPAGDEERAEVERYTAEFCKRFGLDESRVLDAPFTVVTPDSKNPYKQMYVAN